jgi:transcriptional regulator with XRE-family HTH domain
MSIDICLKLYYSNSRPLPFFYCLPTPMATRRLPNYLSTHRKYSGLSQSDVSFLIRLKDKSELSRYERSLRTPSLRTALACQEIYGTSISELFAGLNDSVAKETRGQMKRLQTRLRPTLDSKSSGNRIMQKFQWVSHRLFEMPNFKLVSV